MNPKEYKSRKLYWIIRRFYNLKPVRFFFLVHAFVWGALSFSFLTASYFVPEMEFRHYHTIGGLCTLVFSLLSIVDGSLRLKKGESK
jgi:hypothetical protein